MSEIITGKTDVLEWFRKKLKVHSWETIKRWKKSGLPIRYTKSNAPFIIPSEVIGWAIRYDDLMKDNTK